MSSANPIKPSISVPHAADEAGGEVVFSSDGLDPLPVPPPPTPRYLGDTEFTLVEDEPLVSMEHAMQTFGSLGRQQSPQERLQKLEQELQAIAQQVSNDESLQMQVAQLKSRLAQQWNLLQQPASTSTRSTETSESSSSQDTVITQDLEQVMRRLERAIGTMSLGTTNTATTGQTRNKGLLERVATLEHVVDQLDDRKLEIASRQAKILRSDLQAASKARSKLMPLGASASSSNKDSANYHYDDAKTITLLYNTMVELGDVRSHLPALTQRLSALAQLHTDASTYSQRLAALEERLSALSTQVSSASQSVEALQRNWTESIQGTLQSNLQALDERIAKVRDIKK